MEICIYVTLDGNLSNIVHSFYIHLIRKPFGIIINKLDDIIEKIYNY